MQYFKYLLLFTLFSISMYFRTVRTLPPPPSSSLSLYFIFCSFFFRFYLKDFPCICSNRFRLHSHSPDKCRTPITQWKKSERENVENGFYSNRQQNEKHPVAFIRSFCCKIFLGRGFCFSYLMIFVG